MPTRVWDDQDLAWRAEEACLNAWPAKRDAIVDGWLIRASGGASRRNNSVNPLRFSPRDPRSTFAEARAIFGALGQPVIYRVPGIAPGLDAILADEGFSAPEGETTTLHADLLRWRGGSSEAVSIGDRPGADWLTARERLNGADPAAGAVYREILDLIPVPTRFALARNEGQVVAIAYGAISRGLLVLESVATAPAARRQGFGRQVVCALMTWAKAAGAGDACLQVVADNAAALALYEGLEFTRELYRYHYRRMR